MLKISLEFNGKVIDSCTMDKPEVLIGRNSGNDIVIDNLSVSDRHARIVKEGNQYILEDLGSTNGTFSGIRRIKRMALGSEEDVVKVGKHHLKLQVMGPKVSSPDFQRTIKVDTGGI
jgi:pSer/pThr/pTyr-binding forkhead associated (FHA) protein